MLYTCLSEPRIDFVDNYNAPLPIGSHKLFSDIAVTSMFANQPNQQLQLQQKLRQLHEQPTTSFLDQSCKFNAFLVYGEG
jgi:hypothetical protein